ncbi:recombinase family protein [Mycobacterium simiae]|uniref:recombinase family protein n=1 Tax=Mycobacterium simiae TaxID=1784 RepID=UPI0020CB0742|nr:recombinase family protein [Mycobacterium simiae]
MDWLPKSEPRKRIIVISVLESVVAQTYSHKSSSSSDGLRVGYVRVSTIAQSLDQQNAALAAAGVTNIFSDTMSGARDDRPGLAALMEYVREGDTVVVWKLDRLGAQHASHPGNGHGSD